MNASCWPKPPLMTMEQAAKALGISERFQVAGRRYLRSTGTADKREATTWERIERARIRAEAGRVGCMTGIARDTTPGEWVSLPDPDEGGRMIMADDYIVATIHDGLPEGQCEANARLIAAAPDLYEACKHIGDHPNDSDRPDDAMTGTRVSYGELRAIRAAIAKAEGRS